MLAGCNSFSRLVCYRNLRTTTPTFQFNLFNSVSNVDSVIYINRADEPNTVESQRDWGVIHIGPVSFVDHYVGRGGHETNY